MKADWEAKYYELAEAIKHAAIDCGVYDPKELEASSQLAAMVTAINKTRLSRNYVGTFTFTESVL